MLAVRDGDLNRLGVIFERHHKKLYNFFLRHTGERHSSEDLVQEVFLRFLKYRHTFRDDSIFETWMYRIARNVRIDHYSKRKRSVADGTDFDGLAGENPSPHLEAERSQNHALLLRALSQLSSDEREAVLLSRFDGMKYQEISQIQNCAEGTIKARMHHAMKKLQANFKQLAGDPE